jgi:hypothetical protein
VIGKNAERNELVRKERIDITVNTEHKSYGLIENCIAL